MGIENELGDLKIVELRAKNFLRLHAVEITPKGDVVVLGGRNAQGKSSVLKAIRAAMRGSRDIPEEPINEGANKAEIVLNLGEIKVTRKITKKGTSLVVETAEGLKLERPQDLLNKLYSAVGFDVSEFNDMDPRKQLECLKQLVGLDFSELDKQRKILYDQRTAANQRARQAGGEAEGYRHWPGVGESEVSASDLAAKHAEAVKTQRKGQEAEAELDHAMTELSRGRDAVERCKKALADAEEEVKRRTEWLELAKAAFTTATEAVIDPQPFLDQIAALDQVNRKVRENQRKAEAEKRQRAAEEESERLTDQINEIDNEKRNRLDKAKFPVPGLSFDETGVRLNGKPFANASSAEKIRTSAAIGAALNPKFRVLYSRKASLLDEDSRRIMAEAAHELGCQLWLEVTGKGEGCTVVIEDGYVEGKETEDGN